jgi:TatD DNase family protein
MTRPVSLSPSLSPWEREGYVDTHCHLDLPQFDSDREAVIARAVEAGVWRIICPGITVDSCGDALALADRYAEVYAAVGVHPNDSGGFGSDDVAALRRLAEHPKVVAIGEIGLDYYWDRVPPEQQKAALRAQIALALELRLPVILHSRESNVDLLWEMAQWWPQIRKQRGPDAILGVWHAFSGDLAAAEQAWELGLVLGLGGPVTFRNARELRALAPQFRADRVILETDAPYLAPHPHRGQRNEPAYIPLIAEALATLRDAPVGAVAGETTATAVRCFWPDSE